MVPINDGFVFLFFFSACFGLLACGSEWERGKTVIDKEEEEEEAHLPKSESWNRSNDGSSVPGAKKFPVYLTVSPSNDHKADMKPEKGARDVPKWLKTVLLGIPPTFSDDEGATHTPDLVEILCHFDRMYVRVRREFFKSKDAFKYLKLGTCSANYRNKDYYFLMHSLKTDCGFKIESFPNYLSVSITFHYKPTSIVLREIPFDILLQCRYPRWFYSYKVGFHPKLQGGTLYRALQTKGSFTITPQDASGNEISSFISYSLGHPMYFEASGPDKGTSSGDKRMYINNCFVTASKDPYSHPNYTVIANQGCMIDGKLSMQSQFLAGDSKMVQKFSVGAFIFKDSSSTSPQRFYMHCKMSVGPLTPSESSKACNYDHATHKWKELYGKDSVCKCCQSTCSSAKPKTASENIISSHPWKVDFSSEDEYQEADPQMKATHAEKVSLEDPHMEEHTESTTMSVAKMWSEF